jgi:hypothetical protein
MPLSKQKEIIFSLYLPSVNSDEKYIKSVFNNAKQTFGVVECVDIIHTNGYENASSAVIHFSHVVNSKLLNVLKDGWAVRITHNKKKGSFWTAWHTTRKPIISTPQENRLSESEWPTLTN